MKTFSCTQSIILIALDRVSKPLAANCRNFSLRSRRSRRDFKAKP